MEANEKKEFDTLKAANKALESESNKLKADAVKKDTKITDLQSKLAKGAEDLKASNEAIKALKTEAAATAQAYKKATLELDNALTSITELSAQVADQSTVKTEKDILVKVDGKNYLYERKSLHTINGEVKPEDAAKDMDFLRELIRTEAGNIRPA